MSETKTALIGLAVLATLIAIVVVLREALKPPERKPGFFEQAGALVDSAKGWL